MGVWSPLVEAGGGAAGSDVGVDAPDIAQIYKYVWVWVWVECWSERRKG